MAARFVYWMNVSLDLFVTAQDEQQGEWLQIDEEVHREFNERGRRMSMLIQGRVMYEIMEPFWPAAPSDPSLPAFMQEYGEIWTSKPKVLVSSVRKSADHNTTVVGGSDTLERLAALRRGSDGDIAVGGVALATALQQAHLLDELLLFTHPVVLGRGRPLFDRLDRPARADLLEHKAFSNGVTMHRYSVHGARPS